MLPPPQNRRLPQNIKEEDWSRVQIVAATNSKLTLITPTCLALLSQIIRRFLKI